MTESSAVQLSNELDETKGIKAGQSRSVSSQFEYHFDFSGAQAISMVQSASQLKEQIR